MTETYTELADRLVILLRRDQFGVRIEQDHTEVDCMGTKGYGGPRQGQSKFKLIIDVVQHGSEMSELVDVMKKLGIISR